MIRIRLSFQHFRLQTGPDAWHNFRCDLAAALIFSLFNVVFNQFYIPMAIRQGATELQVGILSAAPAIGLLFSPLWAPFIQRSHPKPFVILPNFIGRLLMLLPAFFGAPGVYVVAALLFHVLMSIQAPAYALLVTRMYPPPQRGRLMANVRVAMVLLMIPMAYLTGVWLDAAGPGGPLAAAAFTGALSVLILLRLRESVPDRPAPAGRITFKGQWSLVREDRKLRVFFLATFATGFGSWVAAPLYQIVQVDRLGLSDVQIGTARVVYFAFLLYSYYVSGRMLDKYSAERTIMYGIGICGFIPMLYATAPGYATVLVCSGLQGAVDAIMDIGVLVFLNRIAPGREAVVFGLHMMLLGIRGTAGPLLSTLLAPTVPLVWLLMAAAVLAWLGAAILPRMFR
ncbi:MAG: MFS transporter [Paenibacillaceae bacterium ZCTH02-B3]|nr:MAG: MFS transporter [Paenibacillaceae bacterium ZCTH02-B3]